MKNIMTKLVFLRDENVENCVTNFKGKMESASNLLVSINTNLRNSMIIITPVTGMDLEKYNKMKSNFISRQQELLDQSVTRVNTEIARYNRLNGVPTPWCSRLVLHRSRRSYHTRYNKLSDDGCHLTDEVILYWANMIVDTINKICR